MNDKVKKDLIILIALIIVCAFCARYFAKGETLEEYASAKASDSSVTPNEATVENTDHAKTDTSTEESDQKNNFKNDSAVISNDSKSASSDQSKDTSTANSGVDNVNISEDIIAEVNDESTDKATNYDTSDITKCFYYEPLSEDIISRITGISYTENPNISLDDLRYLSLLYVDFYGEIRQGEMICNKSIAQDLLEIFYELYKNNYQIESVKLIDEFDGDDVKSMLANNTSCFNYRVVEGSKKLSNHAYGLAVDLNPFYNPYITYKDGETRISPVGSEAYADRTLDFPYKIDENDLAYKLFTQHGFKWGGNWNSVKDYQHFERSN